MTGLNELALALYVRVHENIVAAFAIAVLRCFV